MTCPTCQAPFQGLACPVCAQRRYLSVRLEQQRKFLVEILEQARPLRTVRHDKQSFRHIALYGGQPYYGFCGAAIPDGCAWLDMRYNGPDVLQPLCAGCRQVLLNLFTAAASIPV